jgi:hypothetical protein
VASPSREPPVQESPTGAVTIAFAIDLWPIAGLDLLLVVDYVSSEVVIAYLLAVVTFALIATSAVMLLRQYRAETAPARDVPPEAPAPEAAAEPASEHQPPAGPSAPVDPPPEAPAPVDPPPEAPPPADPPPEPPASDAPTRDAAPVATRPRGPVPPRRKRAAERAAPPSADPSPAPAPAPAPRAASRRAAAPMPAPEATEVCQVHWLGRGRGSCFAAVTVDAQGVKHTLATSRRVEWRDSAPPTETPESQAAVRQLSRILRDNGWEPLRGNGEDLGQERWYARRFRRTAGAGPGGRRASTRTARTGDAA